MRRGGVLAFRAVPAVRDLFDLSLEMKMCVRAHACKQSRWHHNDNDNDDDNGDDNGR